MSDERESRTAQEIFTASYNLPDPRRYYSLLAPLGYRQPEVVANFLHASGAVIRHARGHDRLHVLDFGSGYGALGAMLRHRFSIRELFEHYENTRAEGAQAGETIQGDRSFFSQHRCHDSSFELGGLDIAGQALRYALTCGLIDAAFEENLLLGEPSAELAAFVAQTDLIVETGAVYDVVVACYEKLLAGAGTRPPWLLFGPRGDADTEPLRRMLHRRGYRIESIGTGRHRYRQFMNPAERQAAEERMRALGRRPADHIQAGWFVNPLLLARPEADAQSLSVESFIT